jgi:predicted nicotinamide N-methyase
MILSYYRGCEYLVTFANNFYSSHGIVHDLPQLYQNPSASKLLETLRLLAPSTPSNFSSTTRRQVEPLGVPRYLTSIISSPLAWLESDVQREEIYNLASHVLASRSGRTAMPALTRSFTITPELTIELHEPALTGDNLGFKTWTSSLLLSKRLLSLRHHLPSKSQTSDDDDDDADGDGEDILELGAGTGLVGIAAAYLWQRHVLLTDLPEIVSNLEHNLSLNQDLFLDHEEQFGSSEISHDRDTTQRQQATHKSNGSVRAQALDWSWYSRPSTNSHINTQSQVQQKPQTQPAVDSSSPPILFPPSHRFRLVLAADPIYSPSHPALLINAVSALISRSDPSTSRFIIALPLRDRYESERAEVRTRLDHAGFVVLEEGEDEEVDDWVDRSGEGVKVRCWWGVWGLRLEEEE